MTFAFRGARRLLAVLTVVSGLSILPQVATGQAPRLDIAPGTRVRVLGPNMVAPLVANFLQMRGDTAVFIEDGGGRGLWSIPVAEIRKIERAEGDRLTNRPYVIRGALVGGGVGLLAGLAFASNASPGDNTREYNKAGTAAGGALLGALIGAAIGSRFSAEKWTTVPIRTASIAPSGRGLKAAVSLAF